MRYHNITKDDMLNGDGLRVVLWVAGCGHHCEGCQNPETWDPEVGVPFADSAKEEIFTEMGKDYIEGITFSGGDPLFPGHREEVKSLMQELKDKYPEKTIWSYTGYRYEEIEDDDILQYIDVLVDGPFRISERNVSLEWVGSSNQRVIDVPETRKLGKIVLHQTR